MDSVEADEILYTDYKDENHTKVTSLKFKTTNLRLPMWIELHMEHYGEDALCDNKSNLTTIRLKDDKDGSLIIKFHHTTGVVLIQGSKLHTWKTGVFTLIKSRVDIRRISEADEQNINGSNTCPKVLMSPAAHNSNPARTHLHAEVLERTQHNKDDDASSIDYDSDDDKSTSGQLNQTMLESVANTSTQVKYLEESYVRLCDDTKDEVECIKSDVSDIKSQMKKMPNNIINTLKVEMKSWFSQIRDNETYKLETETLTQEVHTMSSNIQALERERTDLTREKDNLSTENASLKDRVHSMDTNIRTFERERMEITRERDSLNIENTSLKDRIKDLSEELQGERQKIWTLSHRQAAVQAAASSTAAVTQPDHPTEQGDTHEINQGLDRSAGSGDHSLPVRTDEPETVTHRHGQLEHLKREAETLIFGDSTTKYVDGRRYMGRMQSFKQRVSTASAAKDVLSQWAPSRKVQYAILHVGVNDIRGDKESDSIQADIIQSLDTMREKFPDAKVGFSEILFIGRENRNSAQNRLVSEINSCIQNYCNDKSYIYIKHDTLQSNAPQLYDDDVHINRVGSALLCGNIYDATGSRVRRPQGDATYQGGHGSRGTGSTRPSAPGTNVDPSHHTQQRRYDARPQGTNNENMNLDSMLKLLTINMLRGMQQGPQY